MANQSETVVPLRTEDIIRREAAEWLVRLDNDLDSKTLSDGELAKLKDWLAKDPRHGEMLQRQAAVWNDLDIYATGLPEYDAGGVSAMRWSVMVKPVAFACLLLVAIGFVLFQPERSLQETSPGNYYSTDVGGQRIQHLEDGSIAHLNTDSLIKVDYSVSERKVQLLRGEVMFDVDHDPERPFIVYAAGSAVKAVGTRFIVRLASEKIFVSVAEGKVALSSAPVAERDKTVVVAPLQEVVLVTEGETAEVATGGAEQPVLIEVEGNGIEREFSWTNGRIVFVEETLESIINEVNRYSKVRVVIVDPELKNIRLSGRFKIGDTDALLEAIEISQKNIQVSHNNDANMIIISSDSG